MMKKKKVILLGAGAVGVYFVGRLAKCKKLDTTFFVRSEYNHAVKHGYEYKSIKGDFSLNPNKDIKIIHDKNAQKLNFCADYIFICTKVMANIDYKSLLNNVIDENTVLVIIQNGLDIENVFTKAFPKNHIISTVAYIGTQRIGLGAYSHYGGDGKLIFGDYQLKNGKKIKSKNDPSEHCYELENLFKSESVKVDASITNDIIKTRYEKLCWNASFNTIAVMGNHATTKNIMDCYETEQLAADIMREVEKISIADGHKISGGYIQKMLEFTRNFPEYKPSMLIDFEYDRPLEIAAIVTNAIKKAEKLKINVPLLKMTNALLKLADRRNYSN